MATQYNITTITGDTANEIQFTVTVDGVALDLTGAVITLQVRQNRDAAPVISLTSVASAGITIVTPASGIFKINKQIFSAAPGNYLYDIQFVLASGDIKTYVSGTWSMIGDITHA